MRLLFVDAAGWMPGADESDPARWMSGSEFVVGDLGFGYTLLAEHSERGGDHLGRTAKVELHRVDVRVQLKILLQHDFMYKPAEAGPVIFWQRRGEREVEMEVRSFGGDGLEAVLIKDFLPRTRSIPKAHSPPGR